MERNRGLQYHKKRFKFFASGGDKDPEKCDFCKADKEKCKVCSGYSEFINRGFAIRVR